MLLRSPAFVIALCAVCLSSPAATAQDRLSRTELTAISNELGLSVEELQTRSEQLQVQNADIALQMRELEAENAQLNGRIETLQFQLGQSRDEVTRMQSDDQEIGRILGELETKIDDLEARLARREQAFSLAAPQPAGSDGSAPGGQVVVTGSQVSGLTATSVPSDLPSEAEPLFQDGKARLLRFDYEGAERSFRAYLQQYSSLPQAGEAQYWLGEVLYQQKSYSESGSAYSDMIRNYPEDSRAPDALVKLGRSLRLVGDQTRACAILATLPTRYPDASPVTRNLADVERSRSACET